MVLLRSKFLLTQPWRHWTWLTVQAVFVCVWVSLSSPHILPVAVEEILLTDIGTLLWSHRIQGSEASRMTPAYRIRKCKVLPSFPMPKSLVAWKHMFQGHGEAGISQAVSSSGWLAAAWAQQASCVECSPCKHSWGEDGWELEKPMSRIVLSLLSFSCLLGKIMNILN